MGACAVDLVGNLAGMTVRARRRAVKAWTAEEREVGAALAGGVALDAMAVASQLLEAATTAESALEAGQLARAAKDAAVVAGIMTDKKRACLPESPRSAWSASTPGSCAHDSSACCTPLPTQFRDGQQRGMRGRTRACRRPEKLMVPADGKKRKGTSRLAGRDT
jgi:hypothetical protein